MPGCEAPPDWPTYSITVQHMRMLWMNPNFDLIERGENELGYSNGQFETGSYYFEAWMDGLTAGVERPAEQVASLIERWTEAKGDQGFVKVFEALQWQGNAWAARGGGFARTVAPEAWDLFYKNLARANAVLEDVTVAEMADRNPNLIGLKDGVGDIERMTRTYTRLGDRLIYIGGLPTAETFALPLLQLGYSTYSSAIFNFVPEFALGFYADVIAQDRASVYRKLNQFVLPYLDIRDRTKGYAVSIVKAGVNAIGRGAGPVRPPLQDLSDEELAQLTELIGKVG